MKKFLSILLGAILLSILIFPFGLLHAEDVKSKRFIIYFTNWSGYSPVHQNFEVRKIPWDKVTHINHAFFTVGKNFKIDTTDTWADYQAVYSGSAGHLGNYAYYQPKHPDVKALISIGGWTRGNNFHAMASTAANRQTFADSCVAFLKNASWASGVDIDWEYPGIDRKPDPLDKHDYGCPGGPEDIHNYTLMLQTLRETFKSKGMSNKLISIAVPCGYDKLQLFEMNQIIKYVDFVNLMAYDIHGGADRITNHHSALYANPNDPSDSAPIDIKNKHNIDYAVQYLIEKCGVPSDMINLGIPYYGHGWKGVKANTGTNGLFAENSEPATGIWDEPPVIGGNQPYFKLKELEKTPGWVKYRDDIAKVPWIYNSKTGEMWSYDDEISIAAKCDYVNTRGLGGVMIWEIDGDDKPFTLTNTIFNKLFQNNKINQ